MAESNKEVLDSKSFDLDDLYIMAKSIPFLVPISPFIGIITTNLYLQQFNFLESSLINPRFIITGFCVIFFPAFSFICFMAGLSQLEDYIKKISSAKNYLIHFFSAIILLLIPVVIFYLYLNNEARFILRIIGSFLLYALSLFLVTVLLRLPQEINVFNKRKSIFALNHKLIIKSKYVEDCRKLIIIYWLVVLCIYTPLFAQQIYPKIPEQFGGGEPRQIRILFAKDQADIIKQNGMPTCSSGKLLSNWSKPVSLLFEGSENYLLRLDNTRPPIQLKKTTVISLELISEKYNQKNLGNCPSYLTR